MRDWRVTWSRFTLVITTVLLAIAISGCGGGDVPSVHSGSVTLRITWPTADSRELPPETRGIRVTIAFPDSTFPSISRWVPRQAGESVTTVTFFSLPELDALLTIEAYDVASEPPPGTLLATATTRFHIRTGVITSLSLSLIPTSVRSLRCVFSRRINSVQHLFSMQPTGDAPVNLTPRASSDTGAPALSSNGRWLASISDGVLTITDMTARVPVPFGAADDGILSPAWASDDRFAYIRHGGVYVLPSFRDSTPQRISGITGTPTQVAWGGSRQLLVVTSDTNSAMLLRVPLTPQDGVTTIVAVTNLGGLGSPCWNAATDRTAFVRNGSLILDAVRIPLDGVVTAADWTPDGTRLALCWTPPGGVSGLYLYKPGEEPALLFGPEAGINAVTIAPEYTGVTDVPVRVTID